MNVAPPSAPPLAQAAELARLRILRAPHAIEADISWERYRALAVLAAQPALRARLGLAPGVVTRELNAEAEAYRFAMQSILRINRLLAEHINARLGDEVLDVIPDEITAQICQLPLVVEVP